MFEKVGPVGGDKGSPFDDGVSTDVMKVTVAADEFSITYIEVLYANEKEGRAEIVSHGTKRGEIKEFLVAYPKENIISVGGSYDHIFTYDTTLITSLYFELSTGRTSPKFGKTSGTEFLLKGESGGKLVGFFGRSGQAIDAIGAYFETKSDGPQKLESHGGGNEGA
ncbi:unnamed protein product [Microthlaspi erraticum]|uniref:Jacalin-type lectin domain-containing protein n=1 Tax=Microthlaspi erraticum TaxID=1685480 RepID=A0A6D2KE50_9BRAS|nr:unnamed protein product [Microthlaspi erraticum]CAA7050059.1 unnamed protein product [Microthlaspi erraticum]